MGTLGKVAAGLGALLALLVVAGAVFLWWIGAWGILFPSDAHDTTPPEIDAELSPDVLWPPNHELHAITASIQVSDICDASPTVALASVTSSEPDNDIGDGNTNDDIQGAAIGADDREFELRAERDGRKVGRTYTAVYTASDGSGNQTPDEDEVAVPHDRKKK